MLQFLGKLFSPSKSKDADEMEKDIAEETGVMDSELFVRSDGVPGVRVRRPWAIEPLKVCARGEETHYTPIAFSLYCKSEPNEVGGGRGPKYGKFCLLHLWMAPP